MDINLMRTIDRGVGIPLCFLLTLVRKINKRLKGRDDALNIPCKILFIELSEMGSVVLAYPTMKKALEIYPEAELYFLIFQENCKSLSLLNIISERNIYTIRTHSLLKFFTDTFSVIRCLRKERIDIVIDLELFSRFSSILSYLCGARQRVGFYRFTLEGLYRGDLLTHRVAYNPYQHITLNFLSLVYALKSSTNEMPLLKTPLDHGEIVIPHLDSDESAKDMIWGKLKEVNLQIEHSTSIVVLNPHAGKLLPIRAWPLNNYVEVTRRLLRDPGLYVVIIGTKEAQFDAEKICREARDNRCLDMTGKFRLEELISLFNISHVLVTNDGGLPHFASLTSIKMFVFFGPETPELYAPLSPNCSPLYTSFACSPCVSAYNHRKTPCDDNKCLQSIEVEYVYRMIKKSMRKI
jgi:ADP-heptose:LPS heptosyltransferase